MIKSILVAVDGSENSDKALDFALDLAEKYSAAVTVLNVSEAPGIGILPQEPIDFSASSIMVVSRDFRRLHEEILNRVVAHAKALKPNVAVASRLREGNPASEIVATAKEGGVDVVVVGHGGAGRVEEFLMGSVSERVAHLAPCPVIIVR